MAARHAPKTLPDGARGLHLALQPRCLREKYYNFVASRTVRFQSNATGTVTDKDTGTVVTGDELCSWMRVRDEFERQAWVGAHQPRGRGQDPPTSSSARHRQVPAAEGGTPTPFTIIDLTPGFDVDDASRLFPKRSTLKNLTGTPYDLSRCGRGREELLTTPAAPSSRWNVPDRSGQPVLDLRRERARDRSGKNTSDAMAFMPTTAQSRRRRQSLQHQLLHR